MPKRLFQVLSSAQSAVPRPVSASSVDVGYPRPIEVGDRQRLVKLADPQGKVCVSGWSSHEGTSHHLDDVLSNSAQPIPVSASSQSDASQSDAGDSDLSDTTPLELRHLKQHIRQQQRLRRVERQLRSKLELTGLLKTTVAEVASLFGARYVSVLKHCDQTQTFEQTAYHGDLESRSEETPLSLAQQAFPQFWQTLHQGRLLQIFANRLMVPVTQAAEDESDNESDQWLARWSGNWLLVPVKNIASTDSPQIAVPSSDESPEDSSDDRSDNWGVLALSLPVREMWTDSAITAAQSVAVELSLAIAHAQQYQALLTANQELQKLALSDGLTSLANRRRFDEHLASEWQRLARDKRPLSLILCDLDHFKLYNDTFGHPAGDRCLIRVARALFNGPQRPADLVARYGGEEFAIILPNTDTHGAWRIAQKIHESIRALQMPHAEGNDNAFVTVTMGVSTVIPGHDNTPQMLVQASDLALYHAKQHGRNRTYVNGHYNTVAGSGAPESAASRLGKAGDQPEVMPLDEPTTD